MLSNFRSYQMALSLYHLSKKQVLRSALKDQLLRASSSVALNLAEGNDRSTQKDRRRFFNIAFSSLREVQALCELEDLRELAKLADTTAASVYCLLKQIQC